MHNLMFIFHSSIQIYLCRDLHSNPKELSNSMPKLIVSYGISVLHKIGYFELGSLIESFCCSNIRNQELLPFKSSHSSFMKKKKEF
jgi:hypothetical protein